MRTLKTFALAVLILLVVTAALTPVQAKCTSSRLITTNSVDGRTFIWNPTIFHPPCGAGFNPYSYYEHPVSELFEGIFWGLGSGDPALILGDDSGTYAADGTNDTWLSWNDAYYVTYNGLLYAGEIFANWGASNDIDGCIPTNACECVLLSDQVDGVGYFAMASGLSDANGNLSLTQAGTGCGGSDGSDILLAAMPTPTVTRIDKDMDTNDMTFTVTASAPVEGVYMKDGCNCGPIGWVLYAQIQPDGTPAPGDRDAALGGWEAVSAVTPFGGSVVYDSACGAADTDVYLALGLAFADGFPGPNNMVIVSANVAEACGPTVAEPKPITPRIRRQGRDTPRADRTR